MRRGVIGRRGLLSIGVVGMWLVTITCLPAAATEDKVSRFGKYSGYSVPMYDGWSRHSLYVPVSDGTRIAVDYYLPTAAGMVASEPLPVILNYTRYRRAWIDGGRVRTWLERDGILQNMLRYGYAVAIVDVRGTGASFGVSNGPWSAEETADSYEIIEWLARQSWCDGHVGMQGRSYMGMTQYHAASQAPPHLDAIFAEMAGSVLYDLIYSGGTYQNAFVKNWGSMTRQMDLGILAPIAPVDADVDGTLRDAAVAEHAGNLWAHMYGSKAKYRDWSIKRSNGSTWSWDIASSIDGVDRVAESGVAVYHLLGWYDIFTTQQAIMYPNLNSKRQRMTIGPWPHSGGYGGEVHKNEVLRWFDYWLKGIGNGIMKEKPIHYYLMRGDNTVPEPAGPRVSQDEIDAEDGDRWQATATWPPPSKPQKHYLAAGRSGTVSSTNDGMLGTKKPQDENGQDDYTVDYTSTVGSFSRWMDGYGEEREDGTRFFDERTSEDRKALTYTSTPFKSNLLIIGYPVVHLVVSSTSKDGDFFVYLEEVDDQGKAHYITEGALRASYRTVETAPWKNFNLPFHPSCKADRSNLPVEPVELVFDLMGTAIMIDKGHRVRLTVAGADAGDHALYPDPKGKVAPTVSVYRNSGSSSYIELPVATLKERP